jgi:hypothetical protein
MSPSGSTAHTTTCSSACGDRSAWASRVGHRTDARSPICASTRLAPLGHPGCHGAVQLWLVRPAGGPPKLLSDVADGAAWAPDSQRLAFGAEVDAGGGLARLTVASPTASGAWPSDSRSRSSRCPGLPTEARSSTRRTRRGSRSSVTVRSAPWILRPAETTSSRPASIPNHPQTASFPSFVHLHGKRVTLLVLHNGKRRVVLSRPNFFFAHAWSRRGHLLAFAATNRFGEDRIFVYDPDRAKPLRAVTRWGYGPVRSIAWSRDGRRIPL